MDQLATAIIVMSLVAFLINLVFGMRSDFGALVHAALERDWLTFRSGASVFIILAAALSAGAGRFLLSGVLLFSAATIRLLGPSITRTVWGFNDLNSHIVSEVFFHCLAILGAALGLAGVALGVLSDLQTAPRVTIALTLGLTGLVAVNKSATRTRKLCSEISRRSSAVARSFAHLHAMCDPDKVESRTDELKQKCFEDIDALARALDTRLNTGYRAIGTPILPPPVYRRMVAELRVAARSGDKNAAAWRGAEPKVRKITRACSKWTDEMA
ncbi:hypothetical protein AB0A60_19910 [Streptomyces sp. NPDC046275]|uniref:hypothetical protein n=1 Tax=Streptomyces sp. NPDC046275 TaxID=3157201 RepID=UPI0033DD6855